LHSLGLVAPVRGARKDASNLQIACDSLCPRCHQKAIDFPQGRGV